MAKGKNDRAVRQQRRREKARMHKRDKPDREAMVRMDVPHQASESQEEATLGHYGGMMLSALQKARLAKLDVDRREKHETGQEGGDR